MKGLKNICFQQYLKQVFKALTICNRIFPLLEIQYTALFHTTSVVNNFLNSLLENNFKKKKLISKLPFWPFVDWKGFVGTVTFTNPYIRNTALHQQKPILLVQFKQVALSKLHQQNELLLPI